MTQETKLTAMIILLIMTALTASAISEFHISKGFDCYQYIEAECRTTPYPRLCNRTMWSHAVSVNGSGERLAATGVRVALWWAKDTLKYVRDQQRKAGRMKAAEAAAMADCIEVVGDSVEELRDSVAAMRRRRVGREAMDDVRTWVSGAMTDEETCMEGFSEVGAVGEVRDAVSGRLLRLSRITSIALSFVAAYKPHGS